MSPDDHRHGTARGYRLHREHDQAACDPCAQAWYRYNKRATYLREIGAPLRVSSLGTHRRIRALMALGYGLPTLAERLGIATGNLSYKLQSPYVARATHERVAELFEDMCMKPPPEGWIAQRTRNIAAKRGWPAPLAWDDIDDPDENPTDWRYQAADRGDALRDLDDMQAGISEACARLHINRVALEKWCERHDLADLYSRMVARESVGFSGNQHREAS